MHYYFELFTQKATSNSAKMFTTAPHIIKIHFIYLFAAAAYPRVYKSTRKSVFASLFVKKFMPPMDSRYL